MTKYAAHDNYIAPAPEAFRPLLAQLRAQLAKALPDADEIMAYDMPGAWIRVGKGPRDRYAE